MTSLSQSRGTHSGPARAVWGRGHGAPATRGSLAIVRGLDGENQAPDSAAKCHLAVRCALEVSDEPLPGNGRKPAWVAGTALRGPSATDDSVWSRTRRRTAGGGGGRRGKATGGRERGLLRTRSHQAFRAAFGQRGPVPVVIKLTLHTRRGQVLKHSWASTISRLFRLSRKRNKQMPSFRNHG